MKTDELIRALATGVDATTAIDMRRVPRRLALAVLLSAVLACALMLVELGLNPALGAAAAQPMFWVKLGFGVATAAAGLWLVARCARPGARTRAPRLALAVPVLLVWMLALVALADAAPGERMPLLLGRTWRACPWNIALLAAPAFVCVLFVLRSLAPTRLPAAGAAAGLAAGAIGASVYALHCPEFAAPFIGVWYVLGMLIPTVAGALLGPRVLRW